MPPPLSPNAATQCKRALVDAGFEVFRTRGDEIVLAERPRENLIMDSGVRLRVSEPLEVRIVLRTQKTDYPNEEASTLFERIRSRAATTLGAGFTEVSATATPVADPGDPERTLDTFFEVTFTKAEADLPAAIEAIREALVLEKRV